jgi:hypothetical protein
MRQYPDIAMCWDGVTPQAELEVDGYSLLGPPLTVERMFDALNALRDRAEAAEKRLEQVRQALDRIRP